jgi:hypothetical protein
MAFIDCNIWELNQFPKYGKNFNKYTLANIFHHNSQQLSYQSNNFFIQIPEFELQGTRRQLNFINNYKEILIREKIPVVMLIQIRGIESWVVDTSVADYLIFRKNKGDKLGTETY